MKKSKRFCQKFWPEFLFATIALIFSSWLMWHTFNYKDHIIYIAAKAWSDFAAHIPLIRSFSWGQNWPPQYPLFPGLFIHYHFLFYALVGLLEKFGLNISWALNLPSSLTFFGLIMAIWFLAKLLFKSRLVAFFSVILFLFNSSLSFLEFFKSHPISLKTPIEIFQNKTFPSFGPYDGKIVSAFWNLNIYTNQRHLALAFGLTLLILILILKPLSQNRKITYRRTVLLGLLIGLMPFLHSAVFIMALIIFGSLFLLLKNQRKVLLIMVLIAALVGLSQIFLTQGVTATSNFRFNPGYLIANHLTLVNFISYWFLNLGLSFFLIPLGFIKADSLAKKVFLAFLPLFFIGNLFQFSPEIAANHKFFNLFLIIGNLFTAYAIFLIWQKKIWGKILVLVLILFLTLSGIIDFFPIKNDFLYAINDAPKNPDIEWIKENTPPKSVFLNSSYLYNSASLAGRKIFLGWPYFAWSAGYDTQTREDLRENLLSAVNNDKIQLCLSLKQNNLNFVSLNQNDVDNFLPNLSFWQNNFLKVYNNPQTGFVIYDVQKSCLFLTK
ncbi:MAG: hypothetical protein NT052_02530 [Candidatus Shapirobacteria bacterium]|nr:hypothetical protein [Candidatus Shapirobacteria bacterium]